MQQKYKIIVSIVAGILAALAIAFGILQRDNSPELNSPTSFFQQLKFSSVPKEAKVNNETATTFIVGGDVSLSRNIAYTIDRTKDIYAPFRGMESTLRSSDFNVANLETPFSNSNTYTPKNTLVFNAPKKNIQGLVDYNFKYVSLGNNHAFDQGLDGLKTTRQWLGEHNILFSGTGESLEEAWMPAVYESKGIRIGFISASYSSINDSGATKNNYVARIENTEGLKKSILDAREVGRADIVVVLPHAGTEYTRTPNNAQINFAHTAIDMGADIVIGAHPHWVQTIEEYKDRYIFYSLGNFIFDQNWSKDTSEGLVLKINVNKKEKAQIKKIELLPIVIENNSTPRLANDTEKQNILKKIGQISNEIYPK